MSKVIDMLKENKKQNGMVKCLRIGPLNIPYHRLNDSKVIVPFPVSKREILSAKDRLKQKNYAERASLNDDAIKQRLRDEYRSRLNKELDFDSPVSLTEKINWLKLNYRNTLITRCCDKYAVKDFIRERLGDSYSADTYKAWQSAEEIDFDSLPDSFVMKVNWSSGYNIFVSDKKSLKKWELELIRAQVSVWMQESANSYYDSFNWGYKDVKPVVYAEEFLPHEFVSREYKVFCFNGNPEFTLIELEPNSQKPGRVCVNNDGERLPFCFGKKAEAKEYSLPGNFGTLLELSKNLASGFPFVRVDFMSDNSRIIIGEMTFYSGGGFSKIIPEEWDSKLGKLLEDTN